MRPNFWIIRPAPKVRKKKLTMAATAEYVAKNRASWAVSLYRCWATSLKALSTKTKTMALRIKYAIISWR